ncbi:MAG: ribokinase [Thermoguttaceae bacterium]|jgi:ribokinase
MSKIVVVGSANTDMTIRSKKIPAPGETVVGGLFATAPGGKGANQAVAAARAGGSVTFVARVGDDSLGEEAIKGYQKEGIDVSKIVRDPEAATGVALIMVDETGQNSISVASGANFELSAEDVDSAADAIAAADVVVAQLETPIPAIERAAKLAADANVPFILDPAPAPAQPLPPSLMSLVTIIKPNELEATALTGKEVTDLASAQEAAQKLLDMGVQTAIVTLGSKGSVVFSKDGRHATFASHKVKAVDATAAGDVWIGAFAVAYAESKSEFDAAEFATAAAAVSVTRPGAQPSVPTREEIEAERKRAGTESVE